eukprot:EG_transcript_60604
MSSFIYRTSSIPNLDRPFDIYLVDLPSPPCQPKAAVERAAAQGSGGRWRGCVPGTRAILHHTHGGGGEGRGPGREEHIQQMSGESLQRVAAQRLDGKRLLGNT